MKRVRGWLAVALAGGVLVQLLIDVSSAEAADIVAAVPLVLLAAFAAAGFVRQSRVTRGRARAGWIVATAAAGSWSLSNLLYLHYAIVGVLPPAPSLGEIASLLAVVLAPIALLLCAPGFGSPSVRLRRALDGTVILAAFFLVSWQFVLRDVLTLTDPGAVWVVLLLPAFELLSGAFAVVLLSRSLTAGHNALSLLGGSMLGYAVANLLYTHNLVQGGPAYAGGVGSGYVIATALMALAAWSPLPPAGTLEIEHTSSRWLLLPYAPVALALLSTATFYLSRGQLDPAEVWLVLGTAASVLVRQTLSARTNQVLLRDVTEQRAQLAHLAYHDALTGLPNRALLVQRAAETITAAAPAGLTAVVLLDLDGFKKVNDTYGHGAGDALLIGVADRMRATVRAGDTAARLGGDEFVLLLPDIAGVAEAEEIASRVLAALAAPLDVGETVLSVRASAGVAVGVGAGDDLAGLMRAADSALYRAKGAGKGRVVTATDETTHRTTDVDRSPIRTPAAIVGG